MFRRIPFYFAVALLALAPLGCQKKGAGPQAGAGQRMQMPPAPVTVAKAAVQAVPQELQAIGTVQPYSTVDIKSMVAGQLIGVGFQEGQTVRKGQVLFRIDPRPFQVALQQAEANLQKDQATAKDANVQLARYTKLSAAGVVSRQQYDQVESTAGSANAQLAADKAAIANAKVQLGYCTIVAPITGRTGNLQVHAGNLVKANDVAMVTIDQIRPIFVSFSVPEDRLDEINHARARGRLIVQAHPTGANKSEKGVLNFLNNTVDPNTGTIQLKAVFPNQDGLLWPGQFVNTSTILSVNPSAVVVPNQAVQNGQNGKYVYVVSAANKAEMRPVTTGSSLNGLTEIVSGLQAGETVITDGQLRVIPGASVSIRPSQPASGAGASAGALRSPHAADRQAS